MDLDPSVLNMIIYGIISRLDTIEKPWMRKMSDEYFESEVEVIHDSILFLKERGANVKSLEARLDAVRKRAADPDPKPAA